FHLLVETAESAEPADAGRLLDLAREDARGPFDLARGPLLRARLLQLGPEDAVILLAVHHIVSDGWSLGVLVREVGEHYQAFTRGVRPALPDLPVQYADFAAWQRRWLSGAALEAEVAYWRQALAGAPTVLELPADRPRPAVRQPHGRTLRFVLPRDLADRLRAVSRDQGATLFMTLLAAFTTLLGVYTGRRDLLVGSPVANRGRSELEGLIGFFVNTLVLRADLAGDPAFFELLARTRETTLGAYAHQDVPFDQVIEALEVERDLSHTPLFQVAFALQNTGLARLDLPGVAATPLAVDTGTVKFDWDLSLEETADGLAGRLAYAAALFDPATVRRAVGHLEALLEGVAQAPAQTLSRLPLLTAAERQQLAEWNDPSVPYEPGGFIHELIAGQVARTPDAVAVVFDGRRLTYGALDAQAGQVAAELRAITGGRVGPESIVGVLMERSLEMVVGLLAVWKAGAAYLPLDPEDPAERLDHTLRDAGAAALVTAERFAGALPAAAGELPVLVLGPGPHPLAPSPAERERGDVADGLDLGPVGLPASGLLPDHPAYVIYTSGSTGAPKGVVVSHRALANRARYAAATDRADAFLQKTTIGFDVSVMEIFGPLQTGGRTVLAVPGGQRDSAYLVRLIAEEQVSHASFPPTLLDVLLAEGALDDCRALRTVVTGGETVPPSLPERFFARLADRPDIELFNRYGPTETTVSITAWRCRTQPAVRTLPIGRPTASAEVHLLSPDLRPVPIGVAGEICLGGLCLARGYLGRPELTAEKWIPHPASEDPGARLYRSGDLARFRTDGAIEFLGRVDHQVKIRGFRIELGEVAAVLATHESVGEAVAVVREIVREDGGAGGSRQLVAYFVPQTETPPGEAELRAYLQRRLPDYMLPARFVALPALPTSRTGKVDLAALPPPAPRAGGAAHASDTTDSDGGLGEAPRTPAESTLAAIWSQLLGVERVGLDDNFFSLGGDSILSLQVVARALQAGLRLSPRDVFQHQTIAELARVAAAATESPELLESAAGPVPLTPIQRWFFDLDPAEPHHWNQAVLLEVRRPLPADRLASALAALVAHHDALRLRFTRDAGTGEWRQTAAPPEGDSPTAPALLSALDLSALPPADAETVLAASSATLQGSLDIFNGPLLRAALFDLGAGRPGRLLVVAHHLAIDGVSWRILLDDLEAACDQAENGAAPILPAHTTPFTRWAERLSDLARGPAGKGRAAELDLWSNGERARAVPLPLDFTPPGGREGAAAANTAGASGTVRVALDAETTAALLAGLPATAQAGVDAALLATLAEACCNWSGAPSLLVNVEGHGREAVVPGADLSRTVGWFTTLSPVVLPPPDASDPLGSLWSVRSVQQRLEALPDRGIGYGLLRFGGPHPDTPDAAARLAALLQPEIAFNYLGRLDRVLSPASRFAPADEPTGPALGPRNRRPHLLQVDAAVRGDRLELVWTFGERLHRRTTVEHLAAEHLAALLRLAEQCRTAPAWNADATIATIAAGTEYSPVDFPDVDLDQEQLDLILRQIGGQPLEGEW
ncbi:MAG TPA: amino acid adenylation domain-containing protein, partial [Thermoanaerobaculia bacterium]|nr:amino acid adenylation domain-containing protein [Thermoanaerobaculia bacterium]